MLQDDLIPVLDWFCPEGDYVFVQDNAPIHSSAETSKWMEDRQINGLPSQSPELNIIENESKVD